jgi:hypothetical protein
LEWEAEGSRDDMKPSRMELANFSELLGRRREARYAVAAGPIADSSTESAAFMPGVIPGGERI